MRMGARLKILRVRNHAQKRLLQQIFSIVFSGSQAGDEREQQAAVAREQFIERRVVAGGHVAQQLLVASFARRSVCARI